MKNSRKLIKYLILVTAFIALVYIVLPFVIKTKVEYIPDDYELAIENPYTNHEITFNEYELKTYINENKFLRINSNQYRYNSSESISIHFTPLSKPFNPVELVICVYDLENSTISDGKKVYKLNNQDIDFFRKQLSLDLLLK